MTRLIEFRYIWKHEKSLCTGIYNLKDIANGVAIPPKSKVGNIMKCWELIATDQFTGLLDKNGKKIFEGDKLSQVRRREVFTVTWVDGEPIFLREIGEQLNSRTIEHYSLIVIGNILEA